MTIDWFDGTEYDFLSNFYPSPINWETRAGMHVVAPTVEHVFQAEKATEQNFFMKVMRAPTPGRAKQLGRSIHLRPDWEQVKDDVMLRAVRLKFRIPKLKTLLLSTGDEQLIEGNSWHDGYWGDCQCGRVQCQGTGKNMLGITLMMVRDEIRQAQR